MSKKVTFLFALEVCSGLVMGRMPVGVVSSSGAVGRIGALGVMSTERYSLVGGLGIEGVGQ